MKRSLSVENPSVGVLASSSWEDEVFLDYRDECREGNVLKLCNRAGDPARINF